MKRSFLILFLFLVVRTAFGAASVSPPGGSGGGGGTNYNTLNHIVVSTADSISNIFNTAGLANRHIVIRPGEYTIERLIASGADLALSAPMKAYNWTNVTIEAYGAKIKNTLTNESTMLIVSNWYNCTLAGLEYQDTRFADGTRVNAGGAWFILTAGTGTNNTFRDLTVRDCDAHGIGGKGTAGYSAGWRNTTFDNCRFQGIGWSNGVPTLGLDGGAIICGGPYWKVINSKFIQCTRGPESEGVTGGNHDGFTIENCDFIDLWAEGIFIAGSINEDGYRDFKIKGCTFYSTDPYSLALNYPVAIRVDGCRGMLIEGCKSTNMFTHMRFADGRDRVDVRILGNTMTKGYAGINVDGGAAGNMIKAGIYNNFISDLDGRAINGWFVDSSIKNNDIYNTCIADFAAAFALQAVSGSNDRNTNNIVDGNRFQDTTGSVLMDYGLQLQTGVGSTWIGTNVFKNMATADILRSGDLNTMFIHGGGSGTPGGADTHVQFNNAGAFGGEAAFTYDTIINRMTVDDIVVVTQIQGQSHGAGLGASDKYWGNEWTSNSTLKRLTIQGPPGLTNAPFLIRDTNTPTGPARIEADTNFNLNIFGSAAVAGAVTTYGTNGSNFVRHTVPDTAGMSIFESRSFTNRMGSPVLGIPDNFLIVNEHFVGNAQTANVRGTEPWIVDNSANGGVTNVLERGSPGIAQLFCSAAGQRASLVLGGIIGSEGLLLYATNCIFEIHCRWKAFQLNDATYTNTFRWGISYRTDPIPNTGLLVETTNSTILLTSRLNGGTQTRSQATSNLLAGVWFNESIVFESSGTNALLYHGLSPEKMVCVATNGGAMPHNLGTTLVLGVNSANAAITNYVDKIQMWCMPMGSVP